MKEYKALLDKDEIEVLRKIIGHNIFGIYTKMIDIDAFQNGYSSYFGYTIRFGKDSFLIIKNFWQETKVYTDYWKLNVEFSHEPNCIVFNKEKRVIENAPVSIELARVLVNSIDIYSYTSTETLNTGMSETIIYDSAIIFNIDGNKRICFAPVKNIADGVWFTLDENQIVDCLKESVLRMKEDVTK